MEATEDFKQSSDLTALLTFAGLHCREAGTSVGKADGETSAQGQARLQVLKGQKETLEIISGGISQSQSRLPGL